VIVSMEEFLND